jgi:hypothetical protein
VWAILSEFWNGSLKHKNTKRICDTVINFANLPLKTNFYNLIRHSQSKICLLKLIFEHPRSIFKKLWQTSSRGGGKGEGVWNYSHTFLQKKCGSGPVIHGFGFGFKKSLIYSPHWSCNHINSIAFIEGKAKIEFSYGYLIYA